MWQRDGGGKPRLERTPNPRSPPPRSTHAYGAAALAALGCPRRGEAGRKTHPTPSPEAGGHAETGSRRMTGTDEEPADTDTTRRRTGMQGHHTAGNFRGWPDTRWARGPPVGAGGGCRGRGAPTPPHRTADGGVTPIIRTVPAHTRAYAREGHGGIAELGGSGASSSTPSTPGVDAQAAEGAFPPIHLTTESVVSSPSRHDYPRLEVRRRWIPSFLRFPLDSYPETAHGVHHLARLCGGGWEERTMTLELGQLVMGGAS